LANLVGREGFAVELILFSWERGVTRKKGAHIALKVTCLREIC
jgi:hypothetical protein